MPATVNPEEQAAIGRLLELLSDQTPWYRSLWGVGVILAMEELHEAWVVMRQGHLSEGTVKRMTSSLQKRVGTHPAFSDGEKQFLRDQLQQSPRAEGPAHYALRDLADRVSTNYLSRWGRVVTSKGVRVEHFARSVASHLLDAGFSGRYLHEFIRSKLTAEEGITLPQLCETLQSEMAASPRREFEVLLAYSSVPELPNGVPASWLRSGSVSAWLRSNGFPTTGVRSPVGMVLKVQARDFVGAANEARSASDRFAARALIATGKPLRRIPQLWVKGSASSSPLKEVSRGVGVKELFRGDRIFSADPSQSVDAALELLAHLEESSPPAAVAGGWGAIEGLLADPSNRASAADNLATLVTCSFPRAELTSLSYRAQRTFPGDFSEFGEGMTNRERCRVLAAMILEGRAREMPNPADQAAFVRMKKMLAGPAPWLQTIREEIGDSFHRLYRQRNLILHGGRLDSVALSASLRTVAKLVGAGMDRITHGQHVQGIKPLELVAKANMALALVGDETPLHCIDLLESD